MISTTIAASVFCLAATVYHEARGEPLKTQQAVAEVIIERTLSGRYPTTVCGVVNQKAQFSWVHRTNKTSEYTSWVRANIIAIEALYGIAPRHTNHALFFNHKKIGKIRRTRNKQIILGRLAFY